MLVGDELNGGAERLKIIEIRGICADGAGERSLLTSGMLMG
jgi:hypothetical protein